MAKITPRFQTRGKLGFNRYVEPVEAEFGLSGNGIDGSVMVVLGRSAIDPEFDQRVKIVLTYDECKAIMEMAERVKGAQHAISTWIKVN